MAKIGDIEVGEFPLLISPMEDVSDSPFHVLCKEQGANLDSMLKSVEIVEASGSDIIDINFGCPVKKY